MPAVLPKQGASPTKERNRDCFVLQQLQQTKAVPEPIPARRHRAANCPRKCKKFPGMTSPPSMIHAHKLEIQIPVLLAKKGFKITCKQQWHQCCKVVMPGRGRDQKKMHLQSWRGFLREFPWDEPGQWRSEDTWNLFCSRK